MVYLDTNKSVMLLLSIGCQKHFIHLHGNITLEM